MKTVEQPDEVGVSTNDLGVPPHGADLVVAMLEKEHAFFLLEHCDRNDFFHAFRDHRSRCRRSACLVRSAVITKPTT